MGGFVAAVPRGAPASPELIERVVAASRDRSPDGVRHVVTPEGTLLVQCMFANTPESVGEQLPKCDPSGRVWIVKRGHLNNIDELRGQLRDRLGPDARVHTDADVMLAAYLAWGEDMAGRINGEFTLAIWDGRNHQLFVLRDHLGLRGCYTHHGPEWYVAASEPSQVLPFPGVSDALDEVAVVDYISGWMVDRVRTFYEGIRRPMPATAVTVRGNEVDQRMYWMPSLCADKATKPPSFYAPEVYRRFESAVRSALRSPTAVVCDLSGGLDSSAIVGMAAKLRADEPERIPEFYAHSMLFPGLDCDESPYIQAVLDMWPVPWVVFEGASTTEEPADIERRIRSVRHPVGASPSGALDQVRWMQQRGCRVQVCGDGGDEIFRATPLPLERGLRPTGEIWPYAWWSSRRSFRKMLKRIRRELIRPKVPKAWLAAYMRFSHAPGDDDSCLTERAREIHRRLLAEQPRLPARVDLLVGELWNCGNLHDAGLSDALNLRVGAEVRRPYLDLRMVGQLADHPLLVHRWRGEWRALQKTAFAGLYPRAVAARRDKADLSHAYTLIDGSSLVEESDLFGMALIDRAACEAALAQSQAATADGETAPPWSAYAIRDLSRWRAAEARAVSRTPR